MPGSGKSGYINNYHQQIGTPRPEYTEAEKKGMGALVSAFFDTSATYSQVMNGKKKRENVEGFLRDYEARRTPEIAFTKDEAVKEGHPPHVLSLLGEGDHKRSFSSVVEMVALDILDVMHETWPASRTEDVLGTTNAKIREYKQTQATGSARILHKGHTFDGIMRDPENDGHFLAVAITTGPEEAAFHNCNVDAPNFRAWKKLPPPNQFPIYKRIYKLNYSLWIDVCQTVLREIETYGVLNADSLAAIYRSVYRRHGGSRVLHVDPIFALYEKWDNEEVERVRREISKKIPKF